MHEKILSHVSSVMFPLSQGTIVPARGPPNFGWDPIFQPDGFKETYAELDSEVKNGISHRYKALNALREFLLMETNCVAPCQDGLRMTSTEN